MTPSEVITILREYSNWRKGGDAWPPSPKQTVKAINTAIEMIERMRDVEVALREIVWSNDSKWQADRARSVLEKSK